MTTMLRRNLVIGLGGTGLNVVYSLKRQYERAFGTQRPPGTRFLVLDTVDAQPTKGVHLEAAEFIKLAIPDATRVLNQNPTVQRWFPTEPGIALGRTWHGSRQCRALGRMALFHHADYVQNVIRTRLLELRAIVLDDEETGIRVSDQGILVQVIGSLSGGTGSGILLDVAHICRSILSDAHGLASHLVGMVLLPQAIMGGATTAQVEGNTYATMVELDHYMGLPIDKIVEYYYGSESVSVRRAPFSVVYVINSIQNRATPHASVEDVYDRMAMVAYLSAGGAGRGAIDIIDNLRVYLGMDFNGKKGLYSSVGASELFLDRERVVREMVIRTSLEALDLSFSNTGDDGVGQEVHEFLAANHVTGDGKDQRMDALLAPNQRRPAALDDVVERKDLTSLARISDSYRNAARAESQERIDESRPPFEANALRQLEEKILSTMSRPGGLSHAVSFLNRLIGRYEVFRHEMMQEAEIASRSLEALQPKYEQILYTARKRSGSALTGHSAVREIVRQLGDLLSEEAQGIADEVRWNAAADIYTKLIDVAHERLAALHALRARVAFVRRRLEQELEELHGETAQTHPCRLTIDVPDRFHPGRIDSSAFLHWLADSAGGVAGLLTQDVDTLAGTLKTFARAVPAVADAATLTIDQVLKELPAEERISYLQRLDEMAAPMWAYDPVIVESIRPTQTLVLFGVADLDTTVLDRDELEENIPMAHAPFLAEVGDPVRIYAYKLELAVPAYAISGMDRYKHAYEQLRSCIPLHVEPEFDQDLSRDLFPRAGDEPSIV